MSERHIGDKLFRLLKGHALNANTWAILESIIIEIDCIDRSNVVLKWNCKNLRSANNHLRQLYYKGGL